MDNDIRLEQDDVTVEEIIEECGECTGTLMGAGYMVMVDFRSAGMAQRFGPYCLDCAEKLAQRIRDGLPPAESDEAARGGTDG